MSPAAITPLRLAALLACSVVPAHGGVASSASYDVEHEVCDAGGGISTAGPYQQQASTGGLPGGAAGYSAVVAMEGFAAQLWRARELRIDVPKSVPEASVFKLGCSLELDDRSLLRLYPAKMQWSVNSGPVVAISASGQVTTGRVYQATPAVFRGQLGTLSATRSVSIVDVFKDDFGLYAGDGIDDTWQVAHFGLNNPDAAADADPSKTGQDNLFKFTAGLDPKDPQSRFIVNVVNGPQPKWILLRMEPCFEDRNYAVEVSEDMVQWQPSGIEVQRDEGNSGAHLDSTTIRRKKFYRVVITRK